MAEEAGAHLASFGFGAVPDADADRQFVIEQEELRLARLQAEAEEAEAQGSSSAAAAERSETLSGASTVWVTPKKTSAEQVSDPEEELEDGGEGGYEDEYDYEGDLGADGEGEIVHVAPISDEPLGDLSSVPSSAASAAAESYAGEDDLQVSVTRSGWLTKKGGGSGTLSRRNWKHRWFVLNRTQLTYHKMIGAPTLGCINVKEIETVEAADVHGDEYGFLVKTPKRTYCCVSKSEDDRKLWILALRKARAAFASKLGDTEQGEQATMMMF